MSKLIYIVIAIVTSSALWATRQAGSTVQSPRAVCEVLESLSRFRGTIIEVRGEWRGADLVGNCSPLRTNGYVWGSMIWIEFPANLSLLKEAPVEWTLDEKVWEQAVADLAQLAKDSSGERIEATVVGRLDTPERLEVSPGGNFATPTPNGYGHLNVYPARLVIKNIRDVKPAKR